MQDAYYGATRKNNVAGGELAYQTSLWRLWMILAKSATILLRRRVFHGSFLVKSSISAIHFVKIIGEYRVFVYKKSRRPRGLCPLRHKSLIVNRMDLPN